MGAGAAKPATESQPAESRGTRDRPAGGRERADAKQTSSPHDAAAKSRSRDANAKPAAQPVREWDRHKIRQSPTREREGRERKGREDKSTKPRDKRSADRADRERARHERRGREKNDKSGQSRCLDVWFDFYADCHRLLNMMIVSLLHCCRM